MEVQTIIGVEHGLGTVRGRWAAELGGLSSGCAEHSPPNPLAMAHGESQMGASGPRGSVCDVTGLCALATSSLGMVLWGMAPSTKQSPFLISSSWVEPGFPNFCQPVYAVGDPLGLFTGLWDCSVAVPCTSSEFLNLSFPQCFLKAQQQWQSCSFYRYPSDPFLLSSVSSPCFVTHHECSLSCIWKLNGKPTDYF